ncbi:hypothetical protein DNHGIG_34310 [Collibacillus ludicampi]|uniref:Uncharacterized protein n=1 Tax=Collibacillus ludicampi TaxID=2771369 RepID=A0AAV4LJ30_9BACL|nr:hypothetical protein [Collibacillus ludicampi]GIM47882.1 hypothetical protein DNHGIG_34310 [Collibacillus ludicampi]
MRSRFKESKGIHLLISMLIRYPQVSTIRFVHKGKFVILTFLLNGFIEEETFQKFLSKVKDYFVAMQEFDHTVNKWGTFSRSVLNEVTFITYTQSLNHLSLSEIRLVTALIQEHFESYILLDPIELRMEDMEAQDEVIEHLLHHQEGITEEQDLVAYRDGGKVFVYNM